MLGCGGAGVILSMPSCVYLAVHLKVDLEVRVLLNFAFRSSQVKYVLVCVCKLR